MPRCGWSSLLLVSLVGSFGCAAAQAQGRRARHVVVNASTTVTVGSTDRWIDAAPEQTRVLAGNDETYVGVWVEAPVGAPAARQRAPMALSLVLDTSGSMAGEKIEQARRAAVGMLETLAEGDIVSVYAFSSDVVEIAPPTVVERGGLGALVQRIGSIEASGGTAMYAGVEVGEARLAAAPATHPVRRVVVISDGQANVGPSTPEAFGDLAARGTEHGVQVSAIGIGLDYHQPTLAALAVRSAGRMYHLQEYAQMSEILRQEMALLANAVAVEAVIEIVPGPGVELLGTDIVASERVGNTLRVRLGSLFAGQRRELLVRTRVRATGDGPHELARARLAYREPRGSATRHVHEVAVPVTLTADASQASRSTEPRVQAMLANYRAASAQLEAAELLRRGDSDGAARVLTNAGTALAQMEQAAPEGSSSRVRMEAVRRRVEGRAVRARSARGSAAAAEAYQSGDEAMESMDF